MSYIIQTSCVSVCSSVMINGWGAAMMGVIGVQIAQGYLTGEPTTISPGIRVEFCRVNGLRGPTAANVYLS